MATQAEASGTIVPVKTDGVDGDEVELLKKLEEANRELEADNKSLTVIATTPVLSRKASVSSITSSASSNSRVSNQAGGEEDVGSGCLWDIWGRLVNDWESAKKNFKASFIKELVRKGIPHHFRGLAWQLLLSVYDSPTKKLYVEYLKKTSPSEKLIRRDIARTFPDHDFFKEKDGLGQESLFNVMKAYSLHDREVGYCQGSGFIVGLLLMQMPEEEAFAVLVKLMQEFRLRELFKPSMAELGLCMYQLECMIQDLFPELFMHFQAQGLDTSMYASCWFLTLFATTFPRMVACRVMDVFILEGMEIIFRVALAILQTSHEELMSMDMEGMLRFFQKQVPMKFEAEIDKLLQNAYTIKLNTKKLKKKKAHLSLEACLILMDFVDYGEDEEQLEKEYTALKSKENEEQIELRRLRTENRLLRQRIENLEKESSALADRLIHDQVTRAQEAEETYALKNDLSTTRQKVQNLQKKLDAADELLTDIRQRNECVIAARILDEDSAQKVVETLQEELISVRLRESETKNFVQQLRTKIKELENINLSLQKAPTNDVQHLQEELIAVKLREAEANLSLKEMKQKMLDLEAFWERYMEKINTPPSPKDNKNHKQDLKQLQDELMAVRLKEAQRLGDLKEMKQKLMELETQNHICNNQIRRMDEENKNLKKTIAENDDSEKTLQNRIKEIQRRFDDIESERKEESMLARIKEVETAQLIAELRHQIAESEIQKQEILTAGQLDSKGGTQDLKNRIYDLQDEVLQLKLTHNDRLNSVPKSIDGSDDDNIDEELRNDTENLNRTLSEIVEGSLLSDENSMCDEPRDDVIKTSDNLNPPLVNGDNSNTQSINSDANAEKIKDNSLLEDSETSKGSQPPDDQVFKESRV